MFKDKYKAMNDSIYPSSELIERTKNQSIIKKTSKRIPVVIIASILLGAFYLWNSQKENTSHSIVNQDKDIYFNDLEFVKGETIALPKATMTLDIDAFRESQMGDSNCIVKVTIKDAKITGEYMQYNAIIDKVYYGDIKVKKEIVISDNLYINSYCIADTIKTYDINNQYIIMLSKGENYTTLYPFGNEIAITKNNEYIFRANKDLPEFWWYTLLNEKSKEIKDKDGFYYRNDNDFEKDFQIVVDKYCK